MKKLFIKVFSVLLLVYTLLGFFIIPYYLQHSLPKILEKNLSIETYIDSIHFNPFSFEIKVSNFLLKDKKKKNLVFFETFYINLELVDLLQNKVHLKHIKIDNLTADIDLDKNKTPNFQFLLQGEETTDKKVESNTPLPIFQVDKLEFSYLNVIFTDFSKKDVFRVETKPFDMELSNILIDTNHINDIALKIATKKSGALAVSSKLKINPLTINGTVNVSKLNVNKLFNYLKTDDISFDLDSKALNLQFGYKVDMGKEDIKLSILDMDLKLPQIKVIQDKYAIGLKELNTKIKQVDVAVAKEIAYNVSDLSLKLDEIVLEDQNVNTNLALKNFLADVPLVSSNKQTPVDFQAAVDMPLKGNLTVKGKAIQEPLDMKADVTLSNSSLKPYEPYVREFVNLGIKSFDINTTTSIRLAKKNDTQEITVNGNVGLKNIALFNTKQKQELLKVKSINFKKLSLQDNFLNIDAITIDKPFINFSYNKDKTTNFSHLMIEKKQKTETKKKEEEKGFNFLVKKVNVKNGGANLSDKTIVPHFRSIEEQINIQATNLSLDPKIKTHIEHSSVIDKYALLKGKSTLGLSDPLKALEVSIDLQNVNLPALSAYSGKFIGNKIANGKLALLLNHTINQGQLKSTNNIRIKDMELGEKVESKDAIDAPIGLAIALLEDSNGVIDLDIPMDGDVTNPKFDISDAITDVIVNTIVGIVTAPFKFLAILTGLDGDEDISNVGFEFGISEIPVTQKEKLDKIAEALLKRPQLELTVQPAYSFENDSKVIQEIKFQKSYPLLTDTTKKFQELYSYIKTSFIKIYSDKEYEKLEGEEDAKYPFMVQKLKDTIQVDIKEIEQLGIQRAQAVQNYLSQKGIDAKRVILQENYTTDKIDTKLNQVIVSFKLEAK